MTLAKPAKRLVDAQAIRRAQLRSCGCVACGWQVGGNVHHVLPKGKGGDDVDGNLLVLCGTGTSGCHGAHHGNPYETPVKWHRDEDGSFYEQYTIERRDREWVDRRVGAHIVTLRPDIIKYVVRKLGYDAGRAFLAKTYYVELVPPTTEKE